jgi:hypothetical protein
LLLCGHHYRVSRAALQAIDADVYDQTGTLIASAAAEQTPASRKPVAAAA